MVFKKKYSTAALRIIEDMDDIYAKLASAKPKYQVVQALRTEDYHSMF